MNDDFYVDEKHGNTGGAGTGGMGPGSGGGGFWGGGGGGGSPGSDGSGGGGNPRPSWSSDDPNQPEESESDPEWIPVRRNAPALKLSSDGRLMMNGRSLLLGTYVCEVPPLIEVSIADRTHERCVLIRCGRPVIKKEKKDAADPLRWLLSDFRTGVFTLEMRWQGGHWDYAALNRMEISVFGISLGNRQIALSSWQKIATVKITGEGLIYINSLLAKLS